MTNQLSKDDLNFLIEECLSKYKDQLEAKLHPESKKEEVENIIKKKQPRKMLYWYASGFRKAMSMVFERLGKKDLLDNKEIELLKKMAIEHPGLLLIIKQDF